MLFFQYMILHFNNDGELESLTEKSSGGTITLRQSLLYYKAYYGDKSEPHWQPSGAYIFRPNGTEPVKLGKPSCKVVKVGSHIALLIRCLGKLLL